jgi:hypothetical protein
MLGQPSAGGRASVALSFAAAVGIAHPSFASAGACPVHARSNGIIRTAAPAALPRGTGGTEKQNQALGKTKSSSKRKLAIFSVM